MMQRSKRCLHRNKQPLLDVEFLEDRRLLSAANLLAGVLPTPPVILLSTISGLEAALPSIVSGSASVQAASEVSVGNIVSLHLTGHSSLGDGVSLSLTGDVTIGPGVTDLALDADLDLQAAGASLPGEVSAWIGLESEMGIALSLSSDTGANLGNEDDVGLPWAIAGGVELSGADLPLTGGAGRGGSGEISASGGILGSREDGSKRQASAGGTAIFDLLGFTRARAEGQGDTPARVNAEPSLNGEFLERASLLLADLLADLNADGVGEEPFGVAQVHVPLMTGVIHVPSGEAPATPLEMADLPPEEAGLLSDCAPFNAPSLEQLLEQFLAWLDDLAEELAGVWAGLGIPFWVLLTLAAAATAGEVARRNLGRWQRRLLDAAFAPAPLE